MLEPVTTLMKIAHHDNDNGKMMPSTMMTSMAENIDESCHHDHNRDRDSCNNQLVGRWLQ